MNQPEYIWNPWYGVWQHNPAWVPPVSQTVSQPTYRQSNGRMHFATGLAAGAALTYLLTNREVQQGITNTATKAWGTVRGEMEELKERLADLQAELDYYRSQNQDAE